MTHGMSKKYLMVFLLLLLMGWAMSLRAGMEGKYSPEQY